MRATGQTMAKTEFLQIRVTPADRDRIDRAAASAHLDVSTWARQQILRAVERAEDDSAGESPPRAEGVRARSRRAGA